MCLSFKYPLILGNPILVTPSPSSLVLALEERWKGCVCVCTLGVVHMCRALTCVLLMPRRNS
jgi:hypothetical protein